MTGDTFEGEGYADVGTAEVEADADRARVMRALVEVAIDARPYVSAVMKRHVVRDEDESARMAGALLDRLDGAVADAGDVLGGPAS